MSKESVQSELGETITALRTQRGLSQSELARRADIQASFLSGIETGSRTNIRIDTLIKIAKSLDVAPGVLFTERRAATHEGKPTPVAVHLNGMGGTWGMKVTKDGLKGGEAFDDDALIALEKSVNHDERALCLKVDELFKSTKSEPTKFSERLPWAPGLDDHIEGDFTQLFSGDSSHYRPALMAPAISYLLRQASADTSRQVLVGMGTDTVDILLPYLDVFLFDRPDIPPILVTGANRSHQEENSDAPQNFKDMARVTHLPLRPGAYYVFGGVIYSGGDVLKVDPNEDPGSLEGMKTFFPPHRTQTSIGALEPEATVRREKGVSGNLINHEAIDIYDAMNDTVTINLGDMPDTETAVRMMLDPKVRAVVVVAHALGNVSQPIRRGAIEAASQGKLVIDVSRCLVSNVTDRYNASLINANDRELEGSKHLIIDGGRLNGRSAKALMVRALLEKRNQSDTASLVNEYQARTF